VRSLPEAPRVLLRALSIVLSRALGIFFHKSFFFCCWKIGVRSVPEEPCVPPRALSRVRFMYLIKEEEEERRRRRRRRSL